MDQDTNQQPSAPAQHEAPAQPHEPAGQHAAGGVTTGKNKSKTGLIVGIVAAALVVAGAAAYGVYAYLSNTPQSLMTSAFSNLVSQKELAGAVTLVQGTGTSATTNSGTFAVKQDSANAKNWQASFSLLGSTIKAINLDTTLYVQVNNADKLLALSGTESASSMAEVAPFFKNLNNQWFSLTQNDIKSFTSGSTSNSPAAVVGSSPTYADLQRLEQIYEQHQFVTADKTYGDEVIDGSSSAHFSIKIDRNQYVAFLQALKSANIASITVSDADINSAKTMPETTTDGSFEVWIARDTKKFTQLRTTSTKKGEESVLTVTFTKNLPAFDKFEAPANAKPLSELLTTLLGSSFTSDLSTSPESLLLTQ